MKMINNKYLKIAVLFFTVLLLNILVFSFIQVEIAKDITFQYDVQSSNEDVYQVYYTNDGTWQEEDSMYMEYVDTNNIGKMSFVIPKDSKQVRVDLGNKISDVVITNMKFKYLSNSLDEINRVESAVVDINDIQEYQFTDTGLKAEINGKDPYLILDLEKIGISELISGDKWINLIVKVVTCVLMDIILIIVIAFKRKIYALVKELVENRKLLWNLAKNDFKTKYAGSYLGIVWAFVHPVVTVLVYWFVFQVGFKSAPVENFPFLLWLVAGLVPWFFFLEALISATNSMIEYSYLVKKVVFKISILPIVKIIAAFFVHVFFVCFTIFLFACYGYLPTVYTIQVIYYTFCMFMLVLGISYATSAIIVFFKDLGQIISILLQVGMWMTPIMWSYKIIGEKYQVLLKINPMYYIVEGYRDSLINHVWFWERFNQTAYFWVLTIVLFVLGAVIFKRLKGHFADVL